MLRKKLSIRIVVNYVFRDGIYRPNYKTFHVPKEYTRVYSGVSEYTSKLSPSACKLLYILIDEMDVENRVRLSPKKYKWLEGIMGVSKDRIRRLLNEIDKGTPFFDSLRRNSLTFSHEYFSRLNSRDRKKHLTTKYENTK